MQACRRGFRRAAAVAVLIGVCSLVASGVEVSVLSTEKEEAPGAFVTHVFAVRNDTPTVDTYSLTFDAPPEWGILGAPNSIAVEAGSEETLFVTLTIPPSAVAGAYDIGLTATSEGNPAITATAIARVIVASTRELEVLSPPGLAVAPGAHAEYEFILINRGNSQDSYTIEVTSSKGLPITLSQTDADLAPQERIAIGVRLDVPIDTVPGRDVLTLVVASSLYVEVEADGVAFTTILPPGPEAVGRALMEILPARIRLSIDKNVFTGSFSSRLTFSVSGQIKGGFFSSNLSLNDPLGSDPAEIGSFSILYRRTPTTYSIGNVSQRVTDLIRLSCLGGSVVVDEDLFNLAFIGGGRDEETRFAGRLILGPDEVNLGIAYLGIRDPQPSYQAIWSALASAEPFEDWTIQIEGALGIDEVFTSRAVYFNTEINTSGFFFSGTVFSVGTRFPGSYEDSAGIETSYRLRLSALSLSMSLQHVWDNVIGDPFATTLIRDDLGINLRTTPLEDGPTLSTTIEFIWDRYPDLDTKSEIDTLVSVSITETDGVFPYAFSGKIVDQIDYVLDTHVRRSTFSQGAGLSVDSFYLFLRLTQEKQVDLIQDLVLSSTSDVNLRFRPEGALHEASIAFGNTLDEFDLSASLYIRFVENLDIVFDGSISWDRHDADSISFGWGVSLNANVDIPIPFFVTKGQIEGRVFIDRNGDGSYGAEDVPLSGVIVAADGGEASTNADGLFRFTPFYPGSYTLTAGQLPSGAASADPFEVDLDTGETVWIDIPLRPVIVVAGRLFEDEDQDGVQDPEEGGFAQVRALLSNETGIVADAYTDPAGGYVFDDVLPGLYTIGFDATTLPDRFAFTTPETETIDASIDAPLAVLSGGYIRPRDVIVTFQPPTADFEFSPTTPRVSETIAFDGTFSFDFDGQIVEYAWDFDGDGNVDAAEAVAEHAYPEPGVYEVSLTVVDNLGNADTLTLSIEVGGEAAPPPTQPVSISTFQPPIADFSFMPASPIAGEAVQFDGTLSADFDGEIDTYTWDFDGDGAPDASGPIATHTFTVPGTYTVALTVIDDAGNTDTAMTSIVIGGESESGTGGEPSDNLPVAALQWSPTEPVAGEPILFNGTSSIDPDGQIVAFAWDFDGDGEADSSAPLAERTFPVAGSYNVSLTVTDDDGNTNTITAAIPVAAPPIVETPVTTSFQPPVADFAYMPASPNPGDPILFNGTFSTDFDGVIVSFAWDFDGDGTIDSTDAIAEHVFTTAGTYPVSLTVTDDGGSTDTLTISVEVE